MTNNFYETLGIARGATVEEIRKAYHYLARRYHPDKNNHVDAERIFKQVVKAYTILSDPRKRAAYDQTLPTQDRQESRKARHPQDPDETYELLLSLEEINTGCVKHWTFRRQTILPDGRVAKMEKTLRINICPGCPTNKRIIFHKEGNQVPNRIPANIVFIVQEKAHPYFARDGPNIIYEVVISLRNALCGAHIVVPTLQHEPHILCTFGSVIEPGSTHVIKGLGLPYPGTANKGDLVVSFVISFPKALRQENIIAFEKLLPQ